MHGFLQMHHSFRNGILVSWGRFRVLFLGCTSNLADWSVTSQTRDVDPCQYLAFDKHPGHSLASTWPSCKFTTYDSVSLTYKILERVDSHEFSYLKSPWKLGQYWGCYTFWLDKLSWTICRFPITPSCEVRVSCPKIPRHISFPNVRAATASSLCWISIPVVCTWLNRIVTSIAAVTRQQVHRKLLLQWFCELLLVISFIRQSNGQKKSTQKSWFEIIQLMSYPRTPLKELMS